MSKRLTVMSVSIAFPAMENSTSIPLDTPRTNGQDIVSEASYVDTSSEDGYSSNRSHNNSIGVSSTSSLETDRDSSGGDGIHRHHKHSSVGSKMSSVWTKEKEDVGFVVPISEALANSMP